MILPELPVRDAALLKHSIVENYDVIVVGSGAGGATVARDLAEGGMKVLILEEGAYHRRHRDLAYHSIGRLYRDYGLTSTLGRPIVPVPMGKAFGGTTVINSGTCFRTPASVLDDWRNRMGLQEIDPQEFTTYFETLEKHLGVGPSDFNVMSPINTIVHKLASEAGFEGAALHRNAPGCKGQGMCCYGCPSGAKQSMEVGTLPKALQAGAVAYTHTKVTGIMTQSGRAMGVKAHALDEKGKKTGVKMEFRAPRVILSAGTFFTPQILQKSRIARGNPHLGRHLTLHPATKIFAEFDFDVSGWEGTPQAYYLDHMAKEGIMFEGIFTPPDMVGLTVPYVGHQLIDFIKNYRRMATFGIMIHDESEGRLVNLPFFGPSYLYSLTPQDVEKFKKAVAFLARLFLKGGAIRVLPLVRTDSHGFATMEEVDAFEQSHVTAEDIDGMAFHPLGTCRMGADPDKGVCDQNHQVFGTQGVYVADGSLIPTSLGVNPQMTIMAFAKRLAHQLLTK